MGRNKEIFVLDADGTNAVNLTNDDGFDTSSAWSPDGTRIAFFWVPLGAPAATPVEATSWGHVKANSH